MANGKMPAFKTVAEMRAYQEGIGQGRFQQVYRECQKLGLSCKKDGNTVYIQTPEGKWKFDVDQDKITLFHKNYKFRQSTMGNYHIQWSKETSMLELVNYIAHHDRVNRMC